MEENSAQAMDAALHLLKGEDAIWTRVVCEFQQRQQSKYMRDPLIGGPLNGDFWPNPKKFSKILNFQNKLKW